MRKDTRSAGDQNKERVRECETNKKKRSLEHECVRKRDGGNIYLSPDGSVLGVHLRKNEISSRLSGRGRLCCPAAHILTQYHLPLRCCTHNPKPIYSVRQSGLFAGARVRIHKVLFPMLLSHSTSPSNVQGGPPHLSSSLSVLLRKDLLVQSPLNHPAPNRCLSNISTVSFHFKINVQWRRVRYTCG